MLILEGGVVLVVDAGIEFVELPGGGQDDGTQAQYADLRHVAQQTAVTQIGDRGGFALQIRSADGQPAHRNPPRAGNEDVLPRSGDGIAGGQHQEGGAKAVLGGG